MLMHGKKWITSGFDVLPAFGCCWDKVREKEKIIFVRMWNWSNADSSLFRYPAFSISHGLSREKASFQTLSMHLRELFWFQSTTSRWARLELKINILQVYLAGECVCVLSFCSLPLSRETEKALSRITREALILSSGPLLGNEICLQSVRVSSKSS